MDIKDVQKFAVYTLMTNNFILQSSKKITEVSCKVIQCVKKSSINQKMGSLKLGSFSLDSKVENFDKNSYVVDYVCNRIKARKGFRHYEYEDLRKEIKDYAYETPLISTYELANWAKGRNPNVSIQAFNTR